MNRGCGTPIVCSKTMSCWPSSGRCSDGAIRNRVSTVVRPRPPRSCRGLLILKQVRNWSFAVLEREARANALYRHFTRMGWETVPDAKTLARIVRALGPEVVA